MLSGYSRIPIHEPGRPLAFVGLLLIKKVAAIMRCSNFELTHDIAIQKSF